MVAVSASLVHLSAHLRRVAASVPSMHSAASDSRAIDLVVAVRLFGPRSRSSIPGLPGTACERDVLQDILNTA